MQNYIHLFLLGLSLSFGPCLLFCSPILLPYIAATKKGWKEGFKNAIVFSLSKTVAYLFLGVLAAFLGAAIHDIISAKIKIIFISGGLLISLMGIIIILGIGTKYSFCPKWCKELAIEGLRGTVLLGLIVGILPCIPLLGAITFIAVSSKNILEGFIYALCFGTGVFISPLLLLGPLAGIISKLISKNKILSWILTRLCGIILVLMGISLAFSA